MPLFFEDKCWVVKYIKNPKKVATHSFYPFIHRPIKTRKFRKQYDELTDEVLDEGHRSKGNPKKREIFYANHLDSNIYSFYSHKLTELYEVELRKRNLVDVVTAYRKIQHPNRSSGKNNIDFAEDVFRFIRTSTQNRIISITFDIKSFFDNLDHDRIKNSWKSLLRCKTLPADHYTVYKNITHYSYVDIKDLYDEFKDEFITVKSDRTIHKIKVDGLKYFRDKKIVAFCELKDFHSRIRNKKLIRSNKRVISDDGTFKLRRKGIPQGSPISALLANLYLLDFDSEMFVKITERKGLYRRYSDDIVIVCNEADGQYFKNLIQSRIKDYELEIQKEKTNSYLFEKRMNRFFCSKILDNGKLNCHKKLQYLGFEFDGKFVCLKSCSLAKFYRNMKRSIKRRSVFAHYTNYKQDKGKIFRRQLYNRFSYIGAKRKIKWKYDKTLKLYVKSTEHNWGNFITYATKAHYNMKCSKIKHQIRNHWEILNKLIKLNEALWANTITHD